MFDDFWEEASCYEKVNVRYINLIDQPKYLPVAIWGHGISTTWTLEVHYQMAPRKVFDILWITYILQPTTTKYTATKQNIIEHVHAYATAIISVATDCYKLVPKL